ncbi:hypothetical protein C6A85_000000104560, partial [Mycobacterium sp. ITM-2017-0098]
MGKGANLAAAAGVGAAVFVGWGCGVAAADDTGESSSASDTSSQHDAGPARDEGVKTRGAHTSSADSDESSGEKPRDSDEVVADTPS